MKQKIIIIFFTILFLNFCVVAQETVLTAGGDYQSANGSLSFSVGQTFYTTKVSTNSDYSVSEGMQQPYEISVISQIKKANKITLEAVIYPNPTSNYLLIKLNDFEEKDLQYLLYDANGKLLLSVDAVGTETELNLTNFNLGFYILNITNKHNNKIIKSFKNIKK